MASKRQLEANRANARRSSGPRTPSGKASSSRNALKHGLSAQTVVIGDEAPEQFEELRQAVIAHYSPRTALAHDVADRYAATLWRLRRIPTIEVALAEAARQRAYVAKCTELEREHDRQVRREAIQTTDAFYKKHAVNTLNLRASGEYSEHTERVYASLLEERPFQAPEMEKMSAAQTFMRLIEASDLRHLLGKLNRYETTLMNVALRQRQELEEHRVANEGPKLIEVLEARDMSAIHETKAHESHGEDKSTPASSASMDLPKE